MTFVAQPYERFADDILTAITGGVTREEHRFTGIEVPYALASPGVIAVTIRVYGQQAEAFTVFDPSRDYRFDVGQRAVAWLLDGRVPDMGSYFYVSYEVEEAQRRLTDRNPGSVTTTLSEAFAREFAVLHKQMERVYQSAFVDLATDASLEHVAALLGLSRKDARFAGGEVLFVRSTPATGDITIVAGTLVSTDQGLNFETTDSRTLRRGQLSVVAPIKAQLEGPSGKVEAGAIKNANHPIFGIDGVVNEAATFFAAEKETDEELRRRIKATLERAGKSTVDAIKYGLIENLPEVTEANIQVVERTDEPGLVEVKLGLGDAVDGDLVRRVEESIFAARPAGVRVIHNLPTRTASPSEAQAATARPGRAASKPVDLPEGLLQRLGEGNLALRADVAVQLTERNMSASQKERVEDDIRRVLTAYIETLPMGEPVIYSQMLSKVIGVEGVSDAILRVGSRYSGERLTTVDAQVATQLDSGVLPPTLPTAFSTAGATLDTASLVTVVEAGSLWNLRDAASGEPWTINREGDRLAVVRGFYQANLATAGRKANLADVIVGLMEELVTIGVTIDVEPRPAGEGATAPVTGVPDSLRTALTNAITLLLSGANQVITKAEVLAAARSAIDAAASTAAALQLTSDNPVVLRAEYEDTGRLLLDPAEISLEAHHLARLGDVTVNLRGIL